MNEIKGYKQKKYSIPTKRYCQTLELKDNQELIQEYIKRHDQNHHWLEVREEIRSVGILEMEIYLLETTLFMIVETPLDFDWTEAFKKLAEKPNQVKWEEYMSLFQQVKAGQSSDEKWRQMKRIFYLYE